MTKLLTCSLTISTVLIFAVALAQEKPWFDPQNCAFCKQFAAEPGLLDHMTSEYHNLPDGMLSVTHIDKDYEDAFKRAQVGVGKVIREMQTTGKVPYMCPHCAMLGEFTMKGVKQEQANTSFGIVVLYQSGDSTTVAKLQDFGKRSAEGLAQFKKESQSGKEKK